MTSLSVCYASAPRCTAKWMDKKIIWTGNERIRLSLMTWLSTHTRLSCIQPNHSKAWIFTRNKTKLSNRAVHLARVSVSVCVVLESVSFRSAAQVSFFFFYKLFCFFNGVRGVSNMFTPRGEVVSTCSSKYREGAEWPVLTAVSTGHSASSRYSREHRPLSPLTVWLWA